MDIKKFIDRAIGVPEQIMKSVKKGAAYAAYAMTAAEKSALVNQKDAADQGSAIVQQANRHTVMGQLVHGTGHNEQSKIHLEKFMLIMDRIDRVQVSDIEYVMAKDKKTGEMYVHSADFKTNMLTEQELKDKRQEEVMSITDPELNTPVDFVWHYNKAVLNEMEYVEKMIRKSDLSQFYAEDGVCGKLSEDMKAPEEEIYENIQIMRGEERGQYSIENTLTSVHYKILDEDGEKRPLLEFYTTLRRLSTEDEEDALKDMKRVFLTFHNHRNNDVRIFDILEFRNINVHCGKLVFKFFVEEVLESDIVSEKSA